MTDELFDYFGKGSKKFEPLDDDLDLPEVSPKRNADAKAEANTEKPTDEAPAQDDISAADTTDDADDDIFADFGAGLFDDTTDALPPRKQAPKVKSEAKPKVAEKSKPAAKPTAKAETKPAAKAEVAAVEQSEPTDDSEGGTWDFLAGMLGIGGKKNKPAEATAEDAIQAKVEKPAVEKPAVESKPKPKNTVPKLPKDVNTAIIDISSLHKILARIAIPIRLRSFPSRLAENR